MTDPARLYVVMPLYKNISTLFFINFWKMDKKHVVDVGATDGVYLNQAMKILVDQAMKRDDWDRLVVLEQDMMPPLDAFTHIAEYGPELHVVGSTYFQHQRPHNILAYVAVKPPYYSPLTSECVKELIDNPACYEVDAVGFGMTSISRQVLENWPDDVSMFDATPPLVGHDFWFCRETRKQGYKIYVDSGVGCGHLSEISIGYPDHAIAQAEYIEAGLLKRWDEIEEDEKAFQGANDS